MSDELTNDWLASLAGIAVSEACGGTPKKIASVAGIHPSSASRWASGSRSNPSYRVLRTIEDAPDPWPLVALFAAKAAAQVLAKEGPLPEWRWRKLYVEACNAEAQPDGHEDVVTVGLLTGRATVADQFHADQKIMAATMRRLALGFVGLQNGWTLNGPRGN